MSRRFGLGMMTFLGLAPLLVFASSVCPCSLCVPGSLQSKTLCQDAAQARFVIYGTVVRSDLNAGTSDLRIERVLKFDPFLKDVKVITLPKFVPVDAKNPPKLLVFCDIFMEKLDPYRGVPIQSPAIIDYLKDALAIDAANREKALLFFFNHLEHKEVEIAQDAFLEFAKANDKDLGQSAGKLSATKLRGWIQDPKTETYRLGLYGFLLGACGTDKDAALLRGLLEKPTERYAGAIDGFLAGYIELRPREGWDLAVSILSDSKRPFTQRFAVLRALRFFHGWKPEDTRREMLRGIRVAVEQGDIADLAVDDLRRWKIWDLTPEVLEQYGKKSHAAPIMSRGIIRYALSCPTPEAVHFVNELRRKDADLVKEVEESLEANK